MSDATRAVAAVTWVWLGMVLAISFLEAPLKFRTPGLELRVGLAIGRIVFRALNRVELGLAVLIVVGVIIEPPSVPVTVVAGAAIVLLVVQLGLIRPRLNRRSDAVLAGRDAPRSRAHHAYIVLEVLKVVALIALGAGLSSA